MTIVRCASRWLAVVLVAGFAACGGGGGGDAPITPFGPAASKIFVGDSGNAAIGSAANSNPSAGTGFVDRIITGGSTFLTAGALGVKDFALDAAADRLFVADSTRVLAFDNVSTANGNVAPRVVATATGGDTFAGIYLATGSQLYATVRLATPANEVRVYSSTATNGPALRTFSFTCDFMFDIAIDARPGFDKAYVYYQTGGVAHVAVLSGASTLAGSQTLTQTIDFAPGIFPNSTAAVGMFLDTTTTNGRLYVPNVVGGGTPQATVEVFDNPSIASGPFAPTRTIMLASVISYTNVFVETTANRLYAADPGSLTIAPNASATTSSVGGVRVLAPSGSTFTAVAVKP